MLILCSPHNPVGRIWNKEEIEKDGVKSMSGQNVALVLRDVTPVKYYGKSGCEIHISEEKRLCNSK